VLASATDAFTTSVRSSDHGPWFSIDSGFKKLDTDLDILDVPHQKLVGAWEGCVRKAMEAKTSVEDEIGKSVRAQVRVCCNASK
jgi:ubiquitin carboxyl-terminal hydrolase L5